MTKIKLPLSFSCHYFQESLTENDISEHPYCEVNPGLPTTFGFLDWDSNLSVILPDRVIDEDNLMLARFRFSRKNIPGALLKEHVEKALAKRAGEKLSSAEKKEIKEHCKIRLLREMPFIPSDIFVLSSSQGVRFLSSSRPAAETFTQMFGMSFRMPMNFTQILTTSQREQWLDLKHVFPCPPQPVPGWSSGGERIAETLLWLLNGSEAGGISCRVGKSIKLVNDGGKSVMVCRSNMERDFGPDLKTALLAGYVPVEAELVMESETDVFRTIFPAGTNLKYNLQKEYGWGKDYQADLPLWLTKIKTFEFIYESLLKRFIELRLSPDWKGVEEDCWQPFR